MNSYGVESYLITKFEITFVKEVSSLVIRTGRHRFGQIEITMGSN